MKIINAFLCAIACACLSTGAAATPIQDPIADYLSMRVPDRSEYIGTIESIQRIQIDVNGDGTKEVFVGTWYRHSGSKEAYYYAAYQQVQGGYQRITAANADVRVSSFETIFAGFLEEVAKQGLAIAGDIEVDSPQSGNVTKVGMLRFYHMTNGQLMVEERGALDLAIPEQKATYERYFGKDRVTRKATIEKFTPQNLQQMGYAIPNWEPPPP
jgi:hypothetical protein